MRVMRPIILLASIALLTSCEEDPEPVWQSEFPDILGEEKAACDKQGGKWGKSPGQSGFVCYITMPDANQTCSDSRDCAGVCLARSRTCSPVKPFYGCHEVITKDGFRQTMCIE